MSASRLWRCEADCDSGGPFKTLFDMNQHLVLAETSQVLSIAGSGIAIAISLVTAWRNYSLERRYYTEPQFRSYWSKRGRSVRDEARSLDVGLQLTQRDVKELRKKLSHSAPPMAINSDVFLSEIDASSLPLPSSHARRYSVSFARRTERLRSLASEMNGAITTFANTFFPVTHRCMLATVLDHIRVDGDTSDGSSDREEKVADAQRDLERQQRVIAVYDKYLPRGSFTRQSKVTDLAEQLWDSTVFRRELELKLDRVEKKVAKLRSLLLLISSDCDYFDAHFGDGERSD